MQYARCSWLLATGVSVFTPRTVFHSLAGLSGLIDAVRCRLFMLVPTEQEVKALLDHVDSPYIRAVRPHAAHFRALLELVLPAFCLCQVMLCRWCLATDAEQHGKRWSHKSDCEQRT